MRLLASASDSNSDILIIHYTDGSLKNSFFPEAYNEKKEGGYYNDDRYWNLVSGNTDPESCFLDPGKCRKSHNTYNRRRICRLFRLHSGPSEPSVQLVIRRGHTDKTLCKKHSKISLITVNCSVTLVPAKGDQEGVQL